MYYMCVCVYIYIFIYIYIYNDDEAVKIFGQLVEDLKNHNITKY